MFFGGSQVNVVVGTEKYGIISYAGLELTRMVRLEHARFPGCGDLVFGRSVLEEPAGAWIWALEGVRDVEKLIREKLLHPVIDKLLRGERLSTEEKGKAEKAEGGEEIALDSNIKDYAKGGRKPAGGADGGNIKSASVGIERELDKVDPELREQVEQELTEGERILWIGEPEGSTKGRGLLGAVIGSAKFKEPPYTLYAVTNRRVLTWAGKGTKVGDFVTFGKDGRGPMTYYSPALLKSGLEEDKRFPNGGSIIFRQVKVTITKTTTYKSKMGPDRTTTSTKVEMHRFGVLRVQNYLAVARLIYETLIAPCRDR